MATDVTPTIQAVVPPETPPLDPSALLPREHLSAFVDEDDEDDGDEGEDTTEHDCGVNGAGDSDTPDHAAFAHARGSEVADEVAETTHHDEGDDAEVPDEDEEDDGVDDEDIDALDDGLGDDDDFDGRRLSRVAEEVDEVEAALRAIDQAQPSSPPLDRRSLVARLRRLFPHASESTIVMVIEAHAFDFAECAGALYVQCVLGGSRSSTAIARRSRAADAGEAPASSFLPPFARFDDMFFGAAGPSVGLMQAHVQASEAMRSSLALMRGGPPDAWAWRYIRVARDKAEVLEIIRDVLAQQQRDGGGGGGGGDGGGSRAKRLAWAELPGNVGSRHHAGTWNLLWTWRQPKINWDELLPFQRVNHFPQARQLTRKDLLKKHLHRQRKLSERAAEAFDIMPLTFSLPSESLAFHDAFAECAEATASEGAPPNVWILKPVGLSRGRGISMVDCISDVAYGEQMVIQKYVPNPLLLDGYKFDLRIYVLVTSFQPLEAFLYREGFGRFATEPYSLAPADRHNLFAHLTNSSIQKDRPDAADGTSHAAAVPSLDAKAGGTKVALSQLGGASRCGRGRGRCGRAWSTSCACSTRCRTRSRAAAASSSTATTSSSTTSSSRGS